MCTIPLGWGDLIKRWNVLVVAPNIPEHSATLCQATHKLSLPDAFNVELILCCYLPYPLRDSATAARLHRPRRLWHLPSGRPGRRWCSQTLTSEPPGRTSWRHGMRPIATTRRAVLEVPLFGQILLQVTKFWGDLQVAQKLRGASSKVDVIQV